jgi:hypothetical protein
MGRLVKSLASYPRLVKLSLPRLCCDMEGFTSLAGYLLLGTLKDLEGKILSYTVRFAISHPLPGCH